MHCMETPHCFTQLLHVQNDLEHPMDYKLCILPKCFLQRKHKIGNLISFGHPRPHANIK